MTMTAADPSTFGLDPWVLVSGGGLPDPYTYTQLDGYYSGQQPLSFLPPDVASATMGRLRPLLINWPRLVIDTIEERLDVEGFRFGEDLPADSRCWGIWQANNLDEWSQLCHLEALLHGRSYVLVWADEIDNSQPRISVESSQQMSVVHYPGTSTIAQATKRWVEGDTAFLTIYRPDSIERYFSTTARVGDLSATASAWELREAPLSHDLGEVPVVPFVNRPRIARPLGESELADVIPLADAVNKLATDMMVTSEFSASKRRWATGLEMPVTATSRVSDCRSRSARPGTKRRRARRGSLEPGVQFGEFTEASLTNFVAAIELLTSQIAALSGLPPHYLGLTNDGNPASADAIRSSEAALVKRAQRKQRVFGGSWERVMRLALRVQNSALPEGAMAMETIWGSPETPTVAQKVDAAVKLDQMGMPFRQNLEDLGYTPTQIDRIQAMRSADALAAVAEQMAAADRIVKDYGMSRAAALSAVGLQEAAAYESKVEKGQPRPRRS
jgi:hypothetical protein